jgi:3-methylcrotonyl-CoA carboxylase alpha subunit
MFKRILIANRGEIACRVIRTCKRLGVETVAVYSEADAGALHVALADAAHPIGAAPARASYLRIDGIVAAAKAHRAEAIHPGYGFLSENADFAEACATAGIVFIGPPASAIRATGSKSGAKALMQKAGVPLLPGYHGDAQDLATLRAAAVEVGYPVMLKPVAGGGGRGMRRVDSAAELAEKVESAMREARSSFGDGRLLIEKFLAAPRHVEVQVFADAHGNCIHLHERDCSLQRRHQKVIEEAPAPNLGLATRRALGEAAVAVARTVGYRGAGTVEFLVDGDAFYFMEMNTRLQVEHPVTEMITGLDLVEWQLRIANGEALPLTQSQVRADGHAFEARLYAEDPSKGFAPGTGRLVHLRLPGTDASVRVDSGVREGDAISPYYDSMIAKLIVHGRDRAEALARLRDALAQTQVAGPAANVDFLARIAAHPAFAAGPVDTTFIDRHLGSLAPPRAPAPAAALAIAALAEFETRAASARSDAAHAAERGSPWAVTDGWRLGGAAVAETAFRDGDEVVWVRRRAGMISARGVDMPARAVGLVGRDLTAELGGAPLRATIVADGDWLTVFANGSSAVLQRYDPLAAAEARAAESASGGFAASMPGVVVAVMVAPGTHVEKGATLLVIEAMKVEHAVKAHSAGMVTEVRFAVGDQVKEGDQLVAFTPDG